MFGFIKKAFFRQHAARVFKASLYVSDACTPYEDQWKALQGDDAAEQEWGLLEVVFRDHAVVQALVSFKDAMRGPISVKLLSEKIVYPLVSRNCRILDGGFIMAVTVQASLEKLLPGDRSYSWEEEIWASICHEEPWPELAAEPEHEMVAYAKSVWTLGN